MFLTEFVLAQHQIAGDNLFTSGRDASVQMPSFFEGNQDANIFVYLAEGNEFDGLELQLPDDWVLINAAVHDPIYQQKETLQVMPQPNRGNLWKVRSKYTMRGKHQVVLQVRPADKLASLPIIISPFGTASGVDEIDLSAVYESVPLVFTNSDHLDYAFRPAGQPNNIVSLSNDMFEAIAPQKSFTLSGWINTISFNEVVLSTWNGDENSPYTAEVMVDEYGFLKYFRGMPGRHESLQSAKPVADGLWHYFTLSNDPATGWMKFYIDGRPADSLLSSQIDPVYEIPTITLGRRRINALQFTETNSIASTQIFSGAIGSIIVTNNLLTQAEIESAPQQVFSATALASVSITGSSGNVNSTPASYRRSFLPNQADIENEALIRCTITRPLPVTNLQASLQNEFVTFTWETLDTKFDHFIVEESSDGSFFEKVTEIDIDETTSFPTDPVRKYIYYHDISDNNVLFFRIKKVNAETGQFNQSSVIKIGHNVGAKIVGNAPNPFADQTSIHYNLPSDDRISIRLLNLSGHWIATLYEGDRLAGDYQVDLMAQDHGLPSGIYFVVLETDSGQTSIHTITLRK